MHTSRYLSFDLFPSFQNKDEYFETLLKEEETGRQILNLYLLMNLFSFLYGLAMGSYHSVMQSITAAVKVPLLFSGSIIICIPAFFIIQYALGSRLRFTQMIIIICSGFALTTAIMVSFIPVVVFFLLTGGDYYFLQLLHIAIFVLAGIFGMRTIIEALKFACEKKDIYPKIGVEVFKFWVVILALVGIQLAWNLRPFTGDKGMPFAFTRNYEGNFYSAVIYSVNQLLAGPEKKQIKDVKYQAPLDSVLFKK